MVKITETKYPKVLIISGYNLSGESATDITLRSIFKHWPNDKLLILTTSSKPKSQFAETLSIKNYLMAKTRSISLSTLFKKTESIDYKSIVPGAILATDLNKISPQKKLYSIGSAYSDFFNLKVSNEDRNRIKEFQPDLIYSTLGNLKIIKLSVKLSKEIRIPIIPHFMDDWPSVRYTGSIWLSLPRFFLLKSLIKMFDRAPFGLCISEKMCSEYNRRYKKDFLPLMNLISNEKISNNVPATSNSNNEITLSYFGGLHVNRWKTIKKLSEAIELISKNLKKDIKLYLYTSNENKNIYSSSFSHNVVFKSEISHTFVMEEMVKSDYLIHVESFDIDVFPFIKYSISTKIPEYLAAQRPIIALGPETAASIEYLKSNNCGYVIPSDEDQVIKNELCRVLMCKESNKLVKNASKVVLQNHTKQKVELVLEKLAKDNNIGS